MTFTIDVVGIAITVILALLGFLLARTLNKIDKNQDRMFERLDSLSADLNLLRGEHNSMQAQCRQALERFSHADA